MAGVLCVPHVFLQPHHALCHVLGHILGVPLGHQLVIGQGEVMVFLQMGQLFRFILLWTTEDCRGRSASGAGLLDGDLAGGPHSRAWLTGCDLSGPLPSPWATPPGARLGSAAPAGTSGMVWAVVPPWLVGSASSAGRCTHRLFSLLYIRLAVATGTLSSLALDVGRCTRLLLFLLCSLLLNMMLMTNYILD